MADFDPWKLVNPDESFDEFTRIPSFEEIEKKSIKQHSSQYPLRTVGVGEEELVITEEERSANMHIIGQPGQGKSKLLEHQIRQDIDLGNGLCLLDPSDNGDTAKAILRYCAKIGYEKVIYIDPDVNLRLNKIPTLKLLKPAPYTNQSVDSVLESVNALFGVHRQTDTNRIRRNFSALLNVLAKKGLTINEARYFMRWQPADLLPFLEDDEDSLIVKDSFRSPNHFENYFITTVGRIDTFRQEPISLMTAADTGIDFVKMVREGWVILVNLSPSKTLLTTPARLLGIFIISEIIHGVSVLFHSHPEGEIKNVFNLYIDEATRLASPQIKFIIQYMRKMGLRLIIAHHEFDQFREQGQQDVLSAIKNGCRIKMMFNISSAKDRLEMVEDLGYGGDIHPTLASYANQNIPKRYMVIKKDKETPVRIKVPEVKEVNISQEAVNDYIKSICSNPWYLIREQIEQQINARQFKAHPPREEGGHSKPPKHRTKNDGATNRKAGISNKKDNFDKWKDLS
jgi:hypothetical protein